jgi:hypothetical protein
MVRQQAYDAIIKRIMKYNPSIKTSTIHPLLSSPPLSPWHKPPNVFSPCAICPNILPLKHLVQRPGWSTLIFQVFADVLAMLPRITQRKRIISPVTLKSQPARWICAIVRLECPITYISPGIVRRELVEVRVQGRVPESTLVRDVFQQAEGKVPVRNYVRMSPCGGIVGVRAFRAIGDRAFSVFVKFDGGWIVKSFARSVLRVPDRCGLAVLEANHVVFSVRG